MKQYINLFITFIMGVGLTASSSQAADAEPAEEHSLSDFKLGDHVSGEKRKLSKLQGKVVVLEYWGTR